MEMDLVPKSGLADRNSRVETDHVCLDFQVVSAKEIAVEGVLPEEYKTRRCIKCPES